MLNSDFCSNRYGPGYGYPLASRLGADRGSAYAYETAPTVVRDSWGVTRYGLNIMN